MPAHLRTPLLSIAITSALITVLAGCGSAQDQISATAKTYYERLAGANFKDACKLFDPELRDAAAQQGEACEASLSEQYDQEARDGLREVKIDNSLVTLTGDTAVVPEDAISFGDKASRDGDLDFVKRDGDWYLSGGG